MCFRGMEYRTEPLGQARPSPEGRGRLVVDWRRARRRQEGFLTPFTWTSTWRFASPVTGVQEVFCTTRVQLRYSRLVSLGPLAFPPSPSPSHSLLSFNALQPSSPRPLLYARCSTLQSHGGPQQRLPSWPAHGINCSPSSSLRSHPLRLGLSLPSTRSSQIRHADGRRGRFQHESECRGGGGGGGGCRVRDGRGAARGQRSGFPSRGSSWLRCQAQAEEGWRRQVGIATRFGC